MDSQQLTLSLGWSEVEMMSFVLLVQCCRQAQPVAHMCTENLDLELVVHACFQNFKSTLDSNNRVLDF